MKSFLALVLVTVSLFSSAARAESKPGVRLRAAGVSLTLSGVAMFAIGLIGVAVEANHNATCGGTGGPPCGDAKGALSVPGGALMAASSGFLAAGIPMWVIGDRKIKRTISFSASSFKLTF